jgi:hypothetical protein
VTLKSLIAEATASIHLGKEDFPVQVSIGFPFLRLLVLYDTVI